MDKIKKLIDSMVENELAVSELYAYYAKQFPAFKFWERLSKEEKMHALMLRKLLEKTDFEELSVDSRVFSKREVAEVKNELKKMIKHSSKDNMVEALQNAFRLETTITEQGYFKVFVTKEDSEYRKVIEYLQNATKKHRDLIYTDLKKLLPNNEKIN